MKVRPLAVIVIFSLLSFSSRGDEATRKVQEEMRRRNLYFGDIDGRPTAELTRSVQQYQERKGFRATGEIDKETASSIGLIPPLPFNRDSVRRRDVPLPDVPVLKSDMALTEAEQKDRAIAPAIIDVAPSPEDPSGLETGAAIRNLVAVAELAPSDQAGLAPPPTRRTRRKGSPKVAANAAGQATSPGVRSLARRSQPAGADSEDARPTPALIESVVRGWLRDSGTTRPARETEYYSDEVSYLDRGIVSRRYVEKRLREYYKLWPQRRSMLIGAGASPITYMDGPAPNEMTVKFRSLQDLSNSKNNLAARVETDHLLVLRAEATDLRIAAVDERRVTAKTRALEAEKKAAEKQEKSKRRVAPGKTGAKKAATKKRQR